MRIGDRTYRAASRVGLLLDVPPTAGAMDEPGPWWLAKPLHVLVRKDSVRRSSKDVVSHVASGSIPKGAILETGNGFYVISPELCFIQAACSMELPKLIELGFELCGTYDTSCEGLRTCNPLTTARKLSAFAESITNVNGKSKAVRALRYIAGNSASPMETILTMLLCLPYSMGGYGFALPILNHRIDVRKRARKAATKSYYVCDLYWPEYRVAVEYDSDEFHTGADRISGDSMRRNALAAMEITTIAVTNWQISDGGELNKIAHVLARRVGKQLRYKDPAFTRKSLELRKALLGKEK